MLKSTSDVTMAPKFAVFDQKTVAFPSVILVLLTLIPQLPDFPK
jgi:hypothetical protein